MRVRRGVRVQGAGQRAPSPQPPPPMLGEGEASVTDVTEDSPRPVLGEGTGAGAGAAPRVLIGGVGYWWMGDASFGVVVSQQLATLEWPRGVEVADLDYGALYVAQDLADAQPPYERLILLAGVARGREPGRVYHYRWDGVLPDADEIQERIREAGAGVIDLDHLLVIAQHFRALPDDVVIVEVEPVDVTGGERLSPAVADLLPEVIELVRREAAEPERTGVRYRVDR